ncbi:MAG: hypothetical protein AVDCRST_MAG85-1871, partial [uncultured Solirubrobacteraceae bacterium]
DDLGRPRLGLCGARRRARRGAVGPDRARPRRRRALGRAGARQRGVPDGRRHGRRGRPEPAGPGHRLAHARHRPRPRRERLCRCVRPLRGLAERQRDAFPRAEIEILPDSGHWPFIDDPGRGRARGRAVPPHRVRRARGAGSPGGRL